MKNSFELGGIEYTAADCTAICLAELGDESKRQPALYVKSAGDGECWEAVVFGHDMPSTEDELRYIMEDWTSSETAQEVLDTVIILQG